MTIQDRCTTPDTVDEILLLSVHWLSYWRQGRLSTLAPITIATGRAWPVGRALVVPIWEVRGLQGRGSSCGWWVLGGVYSTGPSPFPYYCSLSSSAVEKRNIASEEYIVECSQQCTDAHLGSGVGQILSTYCIGNQPSFPVRVFSPYCHPSWGSSMASIRSPFATERPARFQLNRLI